MLGGRDKNLEMLKQFHGKWRKLAKETGNVASSMFPKIYRELHKTSWLLNYETTFTPKWGFQPLIRRQIFPLPTKSSPYK